MGRIILYHGSSEIIKKPVHGYGKINNDYGKGFYCTEHAELAKEWACADNISGFANKYSFDMTGLNILNLSSDEYSILHWLAILMDNRKIRVSTPVMGRGVEWLKENYLIDIKPYDVIIGYRADDAYFSFARAFADNTISLSQLSYAMRLGKLGEQFVLKSKQAFEHIEYIGYENAPASVYYSKRQIRDKEARESYIKELEKDDANGIYIRDLIRGGAAND